MRIDDDRNLSGWLEAYRVWEQSGRGWRIWEYAVELEPPLRPMRQETKPVVIATDDARVRGGVSGFFRRNRQLGASSQHLPSSHMSGKVLVEPAIKPRPFYRTTQLTELQLVLPRDLDITNGVSEQFASSLISSPTPLAFEIFADVDEISIQMACDAGYEAHLTSQLKAFFPVLSISKRQNFLVAQFDGRAATVVADFGLSRSFLLPLRTFRSFSPDPLAGLINSFASLRNGEKALFQVLAQPVRHEWIEELQRIQSNPDMRKVLQDREPSFSSSLREKLSSPLFATTLRVIVASLDKNRCWEIVKQVGGSLGHFAGPSANELIALSNDNYSDTNHRLSVLSRTSYRSGMLLNVSELAGLAHLPSASVSLEKLTRSNKRTKSAPGVLSTDQLIALGENLHDGRSTPVTLSSTQFTRHIFIAGGSGGGKSTLLSNMACQIIESGGGCAILDPAGGLADDIISLIPDNRLQDVILFDASDAEYPIGFNPLEAYSETEKYLLSSDLVALFRRYSSAWGSLMEAATAQAINAFLFNSRVGTLPDLKRFLIDKNFQREVLQTVDDDAVRYFWEHESSGINAKSLGSVLIRLDGFLRHPLIRNIVSQRSSKLNFRDIIERRQILLIKISQGLIGQENAALLGSFLISKLYQIALSRQDSDSGTRESFFIFADEIQNYLTPSLGLILAGTRKYGVGLAAATQSFKILQNHDADVAESILTNCLTRICFRLGDEDAKRFANGFSYFTADDLQNLRVGEAIARIERADCDFNLKTFPLQTVSEETARQRRKVIIDNTRRNYAGIRSTAKTRIQPELPATISAQFPAPPSVLRPQTDDKTGVESGEHTSVAPHTYDEEPVPRIGVQPNTGRGGQHHQELQSVIKRMAESYGFRAEIEKVLPGGGRVDVSLESDNLKLACEVSVTTVDYEATNVLKCLEAGYDHVFVVVSNQRKLSLLNTKLYLAVPVEYYDQVKALGLSGLLGFLRDLVATKEPRPKRGEKPPGQRLNFTEACEFFGVGTSTLYRWVREGRVPFYRPGREYQFDRDELVLIGRQDLSGKRKAVVKLAPLTIEKPEPKSKKEEHSRYRKLLKLD